MDVQLLNLLESMYDGACFVDRQGQITFWNQAAERMTGYLGEEVLGRSCPGGPLAHIDDAGNLLCNHSCLVSRTMGDGFSREAEAHLQHKSGHRIPVSIRATPLRDVAGEIVGCAQLFTDIRASRATLLRMRELESLSLIDPLTRLSNRSHLETEIESRLHEKRRCGLSFGLLFLDLDHFRDFNYRFGHGMGDRMLKTVADTLKSAARPYDLFGRWGGEEFLGIFRNVGAEDLTSISRRCRALVEKSTVVSLQTTVSCGATLARADDTLDSVVNRVEELAMLSKEAGRNRVSFDFPQND